MSEDPFLQQDPSRGRCLGPGESQDNLTKCWSAGTSNDSQVFLTLDARVKKKYANEAEI